MNTNSKRLSLKQSLVDFLNTQEGKKCPIKSIWQDLQSYTKKPISAKNYGVTKMNHLLDAFKDVISCENNYVTLRSVTAGAESFERTEGFQLQHDMVLVPHFDTVKEGEAQSLSQSSTTESPLKSFPQFHLSGNVPTVSGTCMEHFTKIIHGFNLYYTSQNFKIIEWNNVNINFNFILV